MTRRATGWSSRRRRMRYGAYRASYILWKVLVEHAAVWHIAIAVAVALFLAVILVMLVAFLINRLPPWVCLVPLWLACAYGVGITAVRFARHWGEFPAMRRDMRSSPYS